MRILAIDLGEVRSGLAVGEKTTGTIQPIRVVEERDPARRLSRMQEAIHEFAPDVVLVGLPLNMDDTEGPQATAARAFAAKLADATGIEVHMQDERLTSFAADEKLKGSDHTRARRKKIQDALAAAELIRDYLASP